MGYTTGLIKTRVLIVDLILSNFFFAPADSSLETHINTQTNYLAKLLEKRTSWTRKRAMKSMLCVLRLHEGGLAVLFVPETNITDEQAKRKEHELCSSFNELSKRCFLEPSSGKYAALDATLFSRSGKSPLARVEFKIRSDTFFSGLQHVWNQENIWCQASKVLYDFIEGVPHYLANVAYTKDSVYWTNDLYSSLVAEQRSLYPYLIRELYVYYKKCARPNFKRVGCRVLGGKGDLFYDPARMQKGTLAEFFVCLLDIEERNYVKELKVARGLYLGLSCISKEEFASLVLRWNEDAPYCADTNVGE